jgi:tetratricopeptide (TPR) repeat protein
MWEHWLYFPSIGFFLIAASVFEKTYNNEKYRIISLVFLTGCVIFYSYLTIKQNTYWRKSVPFFERTLKYAPDNARIYNNLCSDYIAAGRSREAIAVCVKALELEPGNPTVYFNLGNAYSNTGDKQKSIESYQKALKIKPDYLQAYNNLAVVYSASQEIDKAIGLWEKAVRIRPDFAVAHFNLAVFYFFKKQYSLAIQHCDQVIHLGYKIDAEFLKQLEPFRNK